MEYSAAFLISFTGRLLFSHFMLLCWSGFPKIRTGKSFLPTRVVLHFVIYSTCHWHHGLKSHVAGEKYFATELQAFPFFQGIKILCIFHWCENAEVLLLPSHAFASQTCQKFCTVQINMALQPCWGLFSQRELYPDIGMT